MATTLAGTVFTPEISTTSDGGACRWYMDDTRHGETEIPLVIFVHGSNGDFESFDGPQWTRTRDMLMDEGWAVVEGDGGGPQNWGNAAARLAYTEMLNWVDSKIDVGVVVVIGQSMGGLLTYWAATLSPFRDRVVGIVIQNGTTDLAYRYQVATTAGTRSLNLAYGVGDTTDKLVPEFNAASEGHDPMGFDPDLWSGVRVLQNWNLEDVQVPYVAHGQAWVSAYGAHTAETVVNESPTGGHKVTPSDRSAMQAFLLPLVDGVTPPPVGGDALWVTSVAVVANNLSLIPAIVY